MNAPALLSRSERRLLGVQLTMAMLAGGFLLLAVGLRLLAPDQGDVAELVAGVAAALVAVPALAAAWHSLRHPDLHGITDLLVALALIAAWAAGDLVTAALLPLVMTVGHVLEERSSAWITRGDRRARPAHAGANPATVGLRRGRGGADLCATRRRAGAGESW